ncbi:Lrp/AsnC family transcriptional regulator [Actinomadura harenae]|uniref:Lrp/AsnC family transcriptional regulator n=1 Tax=Actinomadura harenae TaxID=2483351 RepID=A0A3M2LRD8_9ACTN|nr:Lrp/AsnC family transcriptional regulator [Actinomadura harenae]RMI39967.1 Lrp/AsnC family transcriptional regulator [Actinomadura harenae]
MRDLDGFDRMILSALQQDGRVTYQALTDQTRLSRTSTRTRLHMLLDQGAATVVASAHPALFGQAVQAQLLVTAHADPAEAAKTLIAHRSTSGCQRTTGANHDLVVRIRARDDADLAAEVDQLRRHRAVHRLKVFRAVNVITDAAEPAPPPSPGPAASSLDAVDWQLLVLLQDDPRASFSTLSQGVGLSQAATRARVRGLLEAGVVRIAAVVHPAGAGLPQALGFAVSPTTAAEDVGAELAQRPGVTAVATGWGPCDILGTAAARSTPHLAAVLGGMRSVGGIDRLTTWTVLDTLAPVTPIAVRRHRPPRTLTTLDDQPWAPVSP